MCLRLSTVSSRPLAPSVFADGGHVELKVVVEKVGMGRVVVAAVDRTVDFLYQADVVEAADGNGDGSFRMPEEVDHPVEGDRLVLREQETDNEALQTLQSIRLVEIAKFLDEFFFGGRRLPHVSEPLGKRSDREAPGRGTRASRAPLQQGFRDNGCVIEAEPPPSPPAAVPSPPAGRCAVRFKLRPKRINS
jgi:hypothetical protein